MKQCHQIDQYLGGLLRDGERALFEQHLTTCEECTLVVQKDVELAESLRLVWSQTPSPTTSESQKHKILTRAFGAQQRKTSLVVWATGAAVVVTLVFVALRLTTPAGTSPEKPSFALPSQILHLSAATARLPHGAGEGHVIVREGGSLLFELGADRIGVAPGSECRVKVVRGITTLSLEKGVVAVQKKKGGTQHTFLVTSRSYVVRVVGTRFFVARTGEGITAGVSEGTITVSVNGGKHHILPKGSQLRLSHLEKPRMESLLPTWRHRIDHLLSLPGAAGVPHSRTQPTHPVTKPVIETPPDLAPAAMTPPEQPENTTTHEAPAHPKSPSVKKGVPGVHRPKAAPKLNPTEIKSLILAGSYATVEQKLQAHLKAGDPMAWWLLGESQRKRGQFRKALKAYGKCISSGGTRLANRARYRSALLYHDRLGNLPRAIALYRKYLSQPAAQAPLKREASWRLARAYHATGQNKAAIAVLQRMVATYTGIYKKRAQNLLLVLTKTK